MRISGRTLIVASIAALVTLAAVRAQEPVARGRGSEDLEFSPEIWSVQSKPSVLH